MRPTSYPMNLRASSKSKSSRRGGLSMQPRAKHRSVSRPVPYWWTNFRISCFSKGVIGTFCVPHRMCVQRSITDSGAPLTNILPVAPPPVLLAVETKVDMDFRSRENSSVKSLRYFWRMIVFEAIANSWGERRDLSVLKTFIFSTNTVKAVSVASPTFSKIFFVWKSIPRGYFSIVDSEKGNSLRCNLRLSRYKVQHIQQVRPIHFDQRSWTCYHWREYLLSVHKSSHRFRIDQFENHFHQLCQRWTSSHNKRLDVSRQHHHRHHTRQTDIWLVVSVPVLSEQITDVQPRVSTDGSERTMAFFFAIRRVPKARQVVITAGRPSGMAATATKHNDIPLCKHDSRRRRGELTESDSDLEVVDSTTKPWSTVHGIVEVTDVDSPDSNADDRDDLDCGRSMTIKWARGKRCVLLRVVHRIRRVFVAEAFSLPLLQPFPIEFYLKKGETFFRGNHDEREAHEGLRTKTEVIDWVLTNFCA